MLKKALKFTVPPINEEIARDNLIADLMTGIRGYETVLNQGAAIIESNPITSISSCTKKTIENVKRKIRTDDLVISKAGKGNSIVNMTRNDTKVIKFLTSMRATIL